jgi:hypothetical protein
MTPEGMLLEDPRDATIKRWLKEAAGVPYGAVMLWLQRHPCCENPLTLFCRSITFSHLA